MTEPEDNVVGAVVTADVPVVEVTVSEDRAQVTRKGRVVVPRGQVTVRIDEAAPVLVDRTLAASVDAPGVEVVDVRARRERVVEEARRPAALRALDRELEAVEDRQRARAAELDRTDRELGTLLEAIAAALSEMAEDAGVPLLVVNHATAEKPGMMAMARYLAELYPSVPVEYVDVEYPYKSV